MNFVDVEDARLRYEHLLRPGAPALLFVNSLGCSLEMWDDQVESLRDRFEIVRYDARGHGQSTPGSRAELTMERLARDAMAVLDACGIARAHVCGLSIGGMTTMCLARHWPDRVLKIALCNTTTYMPTREAWQARIDMIRAQGMTAITEMVVERWFTAGFRAAEPQRVDKIRQMLLRASVAGYTACCAAIRDMDQREDIKGMTVDTLVIGGHQDGGTTPADARAIVASIAGAQLVLLDAAHLSNVERSEEFTAALSAFLIAA